MEGSTDRKDEPAGRKPAKVGLLFLGAALLLVPFLILGWSNGWLDRPFYPFDGCRFDQAIWLREDKETPDNPRAQMVDDLGRRFLSVGMSKTAVAALLGQPSRKNPPGDFSRSKDQWSEVWSYPVGAWSGFRMDSDFFSLAFDPSGRLVEWWVWQS